MERRRRELALSRLAVARLAQLNSETIKLLEEGKRDIRFSTLIKVADALQEPLEELVLGLGKGLEREAAVELVGIADTDRKLLELLGAHRGELKATAPEIATMMGCSERALWDAVKRQEKAQRLEVERRRGRGKSNTYRLRLKCLDESFPIPGSKTKAREGDMIKSEPRSGKKRRGTEQ